MEYDLVSLKEDSDGQIIKSFCEFLDVYRGTLRKKSVETCSNIFSNNKSTISFKISLINCGICWLSILLIFSFLNIISAVFSQIYSYLKVYVRLFSYQLSILYCMSLKLPQIGSLSCLSFIFRIEDSFGFLLCTPGYIPGRFMLLFALLTYFCLIL